MKGFVREEQGDCIQELFAGFYILRQGRFEILLICLVS